MWLLTFRPTPKIALPWRRFVLRLFGAEIGRGAAVHSSVQIWAPWNLRMGDYAALGPDVDCHNVAVITLDRKCVVLQYSFLCTATHDYTSLRLPLTSSPITIGANAWVCADGGNGNVG